MVLVKVQMSFDYLDIFVQLMRIQWEGNRFRTLVVIASLLVKQLPKDIWLYDSNINNLILK